RRPGFVEHGGSGVPAVHRPEHSRLANQRVRKVARMTGPAQDAGAALEDHEGIVESAARDERRAERNARLSFGQLEATSLCDLRSLFGKDGLQLDLSALAGDQRAVTE